MKDKFISIFEENIQRDGSTELLNWLKKSDFFTAPASTKYHLSREGGLCEHSIHVYERLLNYVTREMIDVSAETIAICGLLHDVCKVDFYKTELRNAKDEYGQWVKVPYYTVEDKLPYGHGEKSVYIVSGFMRLSREEAMAIRWHMGSFDDSVRGGSYTLNNAFERYPLSLMLHIADLEATYLDEKE
ncbi:HD domain-containing protein [Calorimonas adulescens]|nr:HD domain-containing protein [Calorimonas adulescens]